MNGEEEEECDEEELEGSEEEDENAADCDESKRLIKKLTAEIALKTSTNRAFNTDNMAKKVTFFF
jgi:hypothetical protein